MRAKAPAARSLRGEATERWLCEELGPALARAGLDGEQQRRFCVALYSRVAAYLDTAPRPAARMPVKAVRAVRRWLETMPRWQSLEQAADIARELGGPSSLFPVVHLQVALMVMERSAGRAVAAPGHLPARNALVAMLAELAGAWGITPARSERAPFLAIVRAAYRSAGIPVDDPANDVRRYLAARRRAEGKTAVAT